MPAKRKKQPPKPPRFALSFVGSALEDAKQVPVKLRAQLTRILEQLSKGGCRAAGYALSGPPPWPHLCSVHFDGWRVVVAFPADDEVTVVKIAEHDPDTDPYCEIADELGLAVSTEERTKPPCCGPDGEPPIDPQVVEDFGAAFKALTRRERRERSRRP